MELPVGHYIAEEGSKEKVACKMLRMFIEMYFILAKQKFSPPSSTFSDDLYESTNADTPLSDVNTLINDFPQ